MAALCYALTGGLMQSNWFKYFSLGCLVALAGCAGVGVVATSDPNVKLSDASYLFDKQDRPLIAERLIREAIEICEAKSDQLCLAEGYRTYGFFFRSPSIYGKWAAHYQKDGFLEKSATFDSRYSKSIEYFEKAHQIFTKLERFDMLTNINLSLGHTYERMGDLKLACQAYDASLVSNRENLRRNPGADLSLPKEFASYDDYLIVQKKRARCP